MSMMSITQRGTNSVAVDIMPGPSSRIIERACRTGARIRIEFDSVGNTMTIAGTMLSAHRDGLVIAVAETPQNMPLQTTCCDATIFIDNLEYMFASHLLEIHNDDTNARIEIKRPKTLLTWQRRRFVRASIADSTRVQFHDAGGNGQPLFDGAMLNVSADGIACRVDTEHADCFTIDDRITVRFALQPGQREYTLNTIIKNKTPGGTPGTVILGIQFSDAQRDPPAHAHLAQALSAYL